MMSIRDDHPDYVSVVWTHTLAYTAPRSHRARVSPAPLPPLPRAERTKSFSLPSSARLFSHFTTLDPHRYALLPPLGVTRRHHPSPSRTRRT